MKSIFTRAAFIPKDATEIKSADSTAVAYLEVRPTGAIYAKAFSGKRAKPDWYYSFKTEASAREYIAQHAANTKASEDRRKANRAERNANKCLTPLDVWNKMHARGENGASMSAAETAICLRAGLARAFPGVKFSVTSENYAGGCAVRVHWTDGPTSKTVESVARNYSFRGFDGMVDCSYQKDRWLSRDGEMSLAHSPGHAGGGGSEYIGDPHSADCVLVTGGAGYVTCSRHRSMASLLVQVRPLAGKYRLPVPETFADETAFQSWFSSARVEFSNGSEWLATLIHREEMAA